MKADAIRFKLNGTEVAAAPGEMIIEAASRALSCCDRMITAAEPMKQP